MFKNFVVSLSLVVALVGCGGSNSPSVDPSPPPAFTDLDIEPPAATLDIDSSQRYRALVTDSDGAVTDISDQVAWSLEADTGIVEAATDPNVPGAYFAKAIMIGLDTIVAEFEGLRATSPVSVVDTALVNLTVSPTSADLVLGAQQQFSAGGEYADGHREDLTDEVSWTSDNIGIVSVTDSGLAQANSEGNAEISAALEGLSVVAPVNARGENEVVSISISPEVASLFVDQFQQFSAFAEFSDGSVQTVTGDVLWTSSDTSIIAQDPFRKGQFNALSVGIANAEAQYLSRYSATAPVTVETVTVTGIRVSPRDATVAVGNNLQFLAEAVGSDGRLYSLNQTPALSYSVSDEAVAYISNATDTKGKLTALQEGTTTVIADFTYEGEEFSAVATLLVCGAGEC